MTTVTLSIIGSSSHVMPTWACAMAGICACGFLVLLSWNKRTKNSRPTSWAHRTWQPPLPHVGRGLRAQPSQGLAFPFTVPVVFTFVLNDTFTPLASIARHHLHNEGLHHFNNQIQTKQLRQSLNLTFLRLSIRMRSHIPSILFFLTTRIRFSWHKWLTWYAPL